jgi:hypothetical protein
VSQKDGQQRESIKHLRKAAAQISHALTYGSG